MNAKIFLPFFSHGTNQTHLTQERLAAFSTVVWSFDNTSASHVSSCVSWAHIAVVVLRCRRSGSGDLFSDAVCTLTQHIASRLAGGVVQASPLTLGDSCDANAQSVSSDTDCVSFVHCALCTARFIEHGNEQKAEFGIFPGVCQN